MKRLAIIGVGPRGLYALENLLMELSNVNEQVNLILFEHFREPGSGDVWHTQQSNSNWINITERGLVGIEKRPEIRSNQITIPEFPSYHNWSKFSQSKDEPDQFPERKKLGHYLNARFNTIYDVIQTLDTFQLINSKVLNVDLEDKFIKVSTSNNSFICDDILLTIGHQSTELSKQLKDWKSHVKSHNELILFEDPYPVKQLKSVKNSTNINVGIRGFGLAMIDVMRYLTINDYGNFRVTDASTFKTTYYKTKEQHLKLIPFSLNGLPLAPKPLNESIDNWYHPTSKELDDFKSEIEAVSQTNKVVDNIDFLIEPISKITARVFIDLKDKSIAHSIDNSKLESIISKWLKDADYEHKLFQNNTVSTYQLIQQYIEMALGNVPITLDYCIGQVWRHCQPTLYKSFSHAKTDNKVIENVIALDERSKRYSYGPPIESMQQLLALVDANILTLDFINNPEIETVNKGWKFNNLENESEVCSTMINSVLDAPKLLDVNTLIIKNLLQNDLIEPIHSKLGIETSKDGYVKTSKEDSEVAIAILGRLAKGSVIGVDAILECFGPRIEDWAKSYVEKRLN